MICPKCGKDAGEAKYCPECGSPLFVDGTENSTIEPMEEQGQTKEAGNTGVEENEDNNAKKQNQPSEEDHTTDAEQEHQPSKKKLFIIIAAAATIILVAVIAIVCIQSRKIDVEKELFNSFWVQQDSQNPVTLDFSGGGVTLVDANKKTINLAWEIKGENTVQLNYTFFGTYPYMTLEMTREHGKPVMKYIHNANGKTTEVVFHKSDTAKQEKPESEITETTTEETTTKKHILRQRRLTHLRSHLMK